MEFRSTTELFRVALILRKAGKSLNEAMDPTESALAARLRTLLPPQRQNQPVDVQISVEVVFHLY